MRAGGNGLAEGNCVPDGGACRIGVDVGAGVDAGEDGAWFDAFTRFHQVVEADGVVNVVGAIFSLLRNPASHG